MYKYYPCLISKKGEIDALKRLDQENKNQLSPILDLVHEGMGLGKVTEQIKKNWGFPGNRILIDFSRFTSTKDLTDIDGLFKSLRLGNVKAVPVVWLSGSPEQRRIAKNQIARNKLGAAIRLPFKVGEIHNVNSQVSALIDELGVKDSDTVLILDFGYVQRTDVNRVSDTAINVINNLTSKNFKSVVLLSGSFPVDLTEFKKSYSPQAIRRIEETIFVRVSRAHTFVKYGDYGTKHPDYVPPQKHPGTCSVKYSTKAAFVIYKGELAQNSSIGSGQYIKHCRKLTKEPTIYQGEGFSWGDLKIKQISKEKITDDKKKTGSSTTWVTISLTHHMTLINQLSN